MRYYQAEARQWPPVCIGFCLSVFLALSPHPLDLQPVSHVPEASFLPMGPFLEPLSLARVTPDRPDRTLLSQYRFILI